MSAAQGEAWRLLSAKVQIALRNRVLHAQRKLTQWCLHEDLVTGAGAGERRYGVGVCVGLATVAPLGEHLGGVDLTRPWQRREDRPVRVLVKP